MHEIIHTLTDIVRNTILITGLVVSMMMMIEVINTRTKGKLFSRMTGNGFRQVVIASVLGMIPGCMGGFAAVSLYTHRMLSFGALAAMMIASSGDEAFVMLAMFPDKALILMAGLFVIAVITGITVDYVSGKRKHGHVCSTGYVIHDDEHGNTCEYGPRTFGWKRACMFGGLLLFAMALISGMLSHSHGDECTHAHNHINLLNEDWMNAIFGVLCIIMMYIIARSDNHLINEHLWNHIIRKHLPTVLLWTFGVLMIVGFGLQFFSLGEWSSRNVPLLIFAAALLGIIPESGPHLIFVTLFATGNIPMSVLAASSISQDGHSSIPLLAEDRKGFVRAKAVNLLVALIAGYVMYGFGL